MELIFRSSLPAPYHDAMTRLVFFNRGQRAAETAIVQVVDRYGTPVIVAGAAGLRVVVSSREDVQCVFALTPGAAGREPALAGMVLFLRTSIAEIEVLHIAVADHCRRSRRAASDIVIALVQAVRASAQRLRGVERLTMAYLNGRAFQITVGSDAQLVRNGTDRVASELA